MEKLNINQWAKEDRPREKMADLGTEALSNAELLAILIGSGSTDESAVDLMKKVLNDCNNSLNTLGKKTIADLCKYKGIGKAMLQLGLDFAFNIYKANRVTLGVLEDNTPGINCYTAIGFDDTGNRESYIINGEEHHAIEMDVLVTFSYVKGREYPDPEYAKYDQVRIVTIKGLDQQPCGTPHVNHTGEIGSFVLLHSEHISSGTRIYFACSRAADWMLVREDRLLHELAGILNTGISELPEKLEKLFENNKKQKAELQDLTRSLCRYEAAEYAEKEPLIIDLGKNQSQKLRVFSQEYGRVAKCTTMIYSAGSLIDFAIVSPDQKARDFLEILKQKTGCSGGGSPKIVSGRSELSKADFAAAAEAMMKEKRGQ